MASDCPSSDQDRDWANLLSEVLTLIAKRLSPLDYGSFSNVCKPWASVASPANGMPTALPFGNRRPYLLLPGEDGEQSESCTLIDICDNHRCYKFEPLPEIRGKWCVGSQFGWLAVSDEFSNPSLLNPFSRSQIDLPQITTLPKIKPIYDSDGHTLSAYLYDPLFADEEDHEAYNNDQPVSLKEFRERFSIHKLVLSSDPSKEGSFAAAALLGIARVPIFTRPGEGKWNIVWDWENIPHLVVDITYYKGKFLLVTAPGDVYAIDPIDLQLTLFARSYHPDGSSEARYLLDVSGVLMHIDRSDIKADQPMFLTDHIEVWSLDPETTTWIPVKSLGDHSIFIGTCGSVSILARETPGLTENCIYFTDDYWPALILYKEMVRDIGVFNLNDGCIKIYRPPDERLTWPPPIWLIPPTI